MFSSHLVLLFGYSILLIGLGLWIGRRVREAGQFFVAGRALGPLLIFATILAANIGAGSTVGAAGLGYTDGLAAWWWVGSAGIGTLLLAFWVGPRIHAVATRHELKTVGDWLELRYGSPVRATIAILLWLGTLAILAGQLIAAAAILEVVAGVPRLWGGLLAGVVMTVYFTAGGLLSSAWINLVQLVVLMTGFAIALPWILSDAGGWEAIRTAGEGASPEWFDIWRSGDSGWPYLVLLVPAFIVSPGLLQKVYGARDVRAVRLGVGAAGVALMVFAAIPPLLGMLARVYAPELMNPDLALPTVLTVALPTWIGSLGLAAVFSAEISSADAILFMLSTSLSEDLYKRYLRPDADDRHVLRVARGAAVAGGALGIFLAVVLPSVIDSLSIFYSLLGVSLFVPVVAGLYLRRPGVPEAMAAVAGGVAVLMAARLADLDLPSTLGPNTLGLVGSALLFGLVLWLRRARPSPSPNR